jgi:hypothetical protein
MRLLDGSNVPLAKTQDVEDKEKKNNHTHYAYEEYFAPDQQISSYLLKSRGAGPMPC